MPVPPGALLAGADWGSERPGPRVLLKEGADPRVPPWHGRVGVWALPEAHCCLACDSRVLRCLAQAGPVQPRAKGDVCRAVSSVEPLATG